MPPTPTVGAYVINLVRRPERRKRMEELCEGLALPVEFLAATDAQDLVGDELQSYRGKIFHPWKCASSPNRFHNRLLRAGEVACGMSHVRIWRKAAERELDYTLVLEDDADFEPGLWEKVEAYAGDGRRVSNCVVVPGFSYCTYGYVLSRRGVQRLLAAKFEERVMPLDEFIPALYTLHPRADVRAALQHAERLVALAWTDRMGKELITQCELGTAAITGSDTESSACINVRADGTLERVRERDDLRDETAKLRARAARFDRPPAPAPSPSPAPTPSELIAALEAFQKATEVQPPGEGQMQMGMSPLSKVSAVLGSIPEEAEVGARRSAGWGGLAGGLGEAVRSHGEMLSRELLPLTVVGVGVGAAAFLLLARRWQAGMH